jgi:ADP-heptose:LPS heptosyltransferase
MFKKFMSLFFSDKTLIKRSKYFDADWYLQTNPDVAEVGMDAVGHYLKYGWRESRNPSGIFDETAYKRQYKCSMASLLHYEKHGKFRKFKAFMPKFSTYSYASHYENDQDFSNLQTDIKTICYYLPQFHTIPENDEWWGKGFTEWTNVLPSKPRFAGHYQPRLPHKDIGAYDLSDINTFKKQVTLAKRHGIYGFCFYYYWFSGKKLLEKPIENLLKHTEIDMPFCICWANENWTRTWDGKEKDILLKQEFAYGDALNFIKDIEPLLRDKRYIKDSGKPVILIYKAQIIPHINKWFHVWRDYCRKTGIGEISIWCVKTPRSHLTHNYANEIFYYLQCDREVEFPPHQIQNMANIRLNNPVDAKSGMELYSYQNNLLGILQNKNYPDIPIVRSAMLGWDNSARREIFVVWSQYSLLLYYKWLKYLIEYTRQKFDEENRFLFINAWNEWAEGTYLEPDEKYGYSAINTTSRAIYHLPFEIEIPGNAIVIILLERFGDIIASEPIIRILKRDYPDRPLYFLARREYQDLVRYHPDLSGFIAIYNKEQYINWFSNLPKSVLIFNLHFQKFNSDWGPLFSDAPVKINILNYYKEHNLLELFTKLGGIDYENKTPKFYRRPKSLQYKMDFGRKYIIIHALSRQNVRNWDNDKWQDLINKLVKLGFAVVESGSDRLGIKNIDWFVDRTGLNIQDTADILANCECFIGIDSGLAHLANALNVKGVVLLGKYTYKSDGNTEISFEDYMPYSGNYQKGINCKIIRAPQGLPAEDISVEEVYNAVINLIEKNQILV